MTQRQTGVLFQRQVRALTQKSFEKMLDSKKPIKAARVILLEQLRKMPQAKGKEALVKSAINGEKEGILFLKSLVKTTLDSKDMTGFGTTINLLRLHAKKGNKEAYDAIADLYKKLYGGENA